VSMTFKVRRVFCKCCGSVLFVLVSVYVIPAAAASATVL
jgi:hypothetical protein